MRQLLPRLGLLCALGVAGLPLAGCNPTPATDLPPGWAITDTIVNSASPGVASGAARQVVFFSNISWQSTNRTAPHFASGWMNDVLVGNAYSFQLRLDGGNLLNGGLTLRDASGQTLAVTQARVNHGENCGPNGHRPLGGTTETADSTMQCYYDPGEVPRDPNATGFIPRPVLPRDKATYSVELVPSCNGRLQYLDMRCNTQAEPVLVLTVSPAISPAVPMHNQKFQFTIVAKNSKGETTTPFTAVYVEPNRCRVDNFLINPATGSVGDLATAQWFARDCNSLQLQTNDPLVLQLYATQTAGSDVASEPQMNDSRPYQLPKQLEVKMTLTARDAMGTKAVKTATVKVEPCSISPTHPQCPTRCQATPTPSNCPHPPAPACPVGEGDSNRQQQQYKFDILCSLGGGLATKESETEWACTEAAARTAVSNRLTLGCGIVQVTGPWQTGKPPTNPPTTCAGGAQPIEWKFCLACSSQTGPIYTSESRTACYIDEAVDAAKLNRPTQNCWLQNQGSCP